MSEPNPSSLEASAERLRLTLPLLARHAPDYSPQSYAVWFTYVQGTHPRITAVLSPVVSAGTRIDEATTRKLFAQLFDDADVSAIARLRDAFGDLLLRTAASAADTQQRTGNLQAALATSGSLPAPLQAAADTFSRELAQFGQRMTDARSEIDGLKAQLDEVRREASTDALTQILNRRAFDSALAAQVERSQKAGMPLSLVILDADHFKRINDTHGHLFGDRVLQAIAQVLKHNVKGKDLVARFGGEEFAVLLPDTPRMGATQLAEQLRVAIEAIRIRRRDTGEPVGGIAVSCGVATLRPSDGSTGLIEQADQALYQAKSAGRNRVAVAS